MRVEEALAPPEREADAPLEPDAEDVGVAEPELAPDMVDAVLLAPLVVLASKVLRLSEAEAEAVVLIEPLLADEELLGKMAWMRISWHWAPIHSSYRLPNEPLMQRHQRVLPPMASESLAHTEKPPV